MASTNIKLTKDELKNEIELYLYDFKRIHDSFEIYKGIKKSASEYSKEINSISQLIVPILGSLQYNFLIGLAKMLLEDEDKNIQNLLTLCGYNKDVFPTEHRRQYLDDEGKIIIPPDIEKVNIQEDIKNIRIQLKIYKQAINNLDTIRNKFLAHSDEEYYNNVSRLFKENTITYAEVEKLIKIIKDSLNTLIKDLADTTWIFTKEGVEDFTYICKALKENKEMHIKRLKGGKNNE